MGGLLSVGGLACYFGSAACSLCCSISFSSCQRNYLADPPGRHVVQAHRTASTKGPSGCTQGRHGVGAEGCAQRLPPPLCVRQHKAARGTAGDQRTPAVGCERAQARTHPPQHAMAHRDDQLRHQAEWSAHMYLSVREHTHTETHAAPRTPTMSCAAAPPTSQHTSGVPPAGAANDVAAGDECVCGS